MIVSPREHEISRRSRALSLEISAIVAARVSIGRGYQVPTSTLTFVAARESAGRRVILRLRAARVVVGRPHQPQHRRNEAHVGVLS